VVRQAAPKFNVQWVGHPVLDRIHKVDVVEPNPNFVALLPGSRKTEVEKHLPVLWEAAMLMGRNRPGLKFILLSPNEAIQKYSLEMLAKFPAPNFAFEYNVGYAISHLSRCALALVASGTASLECALVGIPQIVVYRVHPLTMPSGAAVIKVKHLSIVNVMANEAVVPEFLQDNLEPVRSRRKHSNYSAMPSAGESMKRRVAEIISTLGAPGASKRAAEAVASRSGSRQSGVRSAHEFDGVMPRWRAPENLRLPQLSRRTSRDHRACHFRQKCLRADADRRRKIALLSDSRVDPTGRGHRDLAVDRINAGSGRCPHATGIKAAAINSSMAFADIDRTKNKIRRGEIDLVYVAPERLLMDDFLALCASPESRCLHR